MPAAASEARWGGHGAARLRPDPKVGSPAVPRAERKGSLKLKVNSEAEVATLCPVKAGEGARLGWALRRVPLTVARRRSKLCALFFLAPPPHTVCLPSVTITGPKSLKYGSFRDSASW